MYKVGIIIPCYNVENYIGRCLDSLLDQTIGYENLQILVVDDCSKDQTLKVLQQYEKNYPDTIALIHLEENRGPSYARNIAFDYVQAEYVLYVDGDDWLEKDAIERLWNIANRTAVDMVMCYNDRPKYEVAAVRVRLGEDQYLELNTVERRKEVFMNQRSRAMIAGRLIRKSVIIEHDIRFPEGYKFEDCYFTMRLMLVINSLYIINETLYHYYWNEQSTVNSGESSMDRLHVMLIFLEHVRQHGDYESYKEEIDFCIYEKFFSDTIFGLFRFGQESIQKIEFIKSSLLSICDIINNSYFGGQGNITYTIQEEVMRSLLLGTVDEESMSQIARMFN